MIDRSRPPGAATCAIEIPFPPASFRLPALLLQVLALTASPAGELTVLDTVAKIEKLLDRLGADLVAPVGNLEEVKNIKLVHKCRNLVEVIVRASVIRPTRRGLSRLLRRAAKVSKRSRLGKEGVPWDDIAVLASHAGVTFALPVSKPYVVARGVWTEGQCLRSAVCTYFCGVCVLRQLWQEVKIYIVFPHEGPSLCQFL